MSIKMKYLKLKDIIEKIYTINDLGVPINIYQDVDNFLHRLDQDETIITLFPVKEDVLTIEEYSSILNASARNIHSHFPKKPYKIIKTNILKSRDKWFRGYIDYLKSQLKSPSIIMNAELIEYINEIIYNPHITMPEQFRRYLKNPFIAHEYEEEDGIHWLRLAWLIVFSILQSSMIMELSSLWTIPKQYALASVFGPPYNVSLFAKKYANEVLDIKIDDEGIIDLFIDFSPHLDIKETPEWASLVCWHPNAPLDFTNYQGVLHFDIRALSGISKISIELQNFNNDGIHKYYSPYSIKNEWTTICENLSENEVPSYILKSFGAVCFVIHPKDFTNSDMHAHLQLKGIMID